MYKEPIQPKYHPASRRIHYLPYGEEKIQTLTIEKFEKQTTLKYLYHLAFSDKITYQNVKKHCFEGIKKNTINKSAEWLGIRYRREVLFGKIRDVYIHWINNQIGFGLFEMLRSKNGLSLESTRASSAHAPTGADISVFFLLPAIKTLTRLCGTP